MEVEPLMMTFNAQCGPSPEIQIIGILEQVMQKAVGQCSPDEMQAVFDWFNAKKNKWYDESERNKL